MLLVYKFLKLLLIYFFKFGANRLIWDRINFDESTIYCLTFFVILKIKINKFNFLKRNIVMTHQMPWQTLYVQILYVQWTYLVQIVCTMNILFVYTRRRIPASSSSFPPPSLSLPSPALRSFFPCSFPSSCLSVFCFVDFCFC